MSLMQSTLRITDHFYDAYDPEAVERQWRLQNCVLFVFILHMMMVIAFIKFQDFEHTHPRVIHDVDVSFELTPPPPPPPKPKNLSTIEGANGGSAPSPLPMDASKMGMPALNAPVLTNPTMAPARPIPSRKMTIAPPVAMTTTNETKAAQGIPKPMEAPVEPAKAPIVGILSNQPPSGAPNAGGAPGATQAGIGTGGNGAGGTGVGQGGLGAGTGEGAPGGKIATALSTNRAQGNIRPYRLDLQGRLKQNWHPAKSVKDLVVLLRIARDGRLLSDEIFQSSGNKKADKEALKAAEETKFAPLPDWYKGDELTFKVDMIGLEGN